MGDDRKIELLETVKKILISNSSSNSQRGICRVIQSLYYTEMCSELERDSLLIYVSLNKPTINNQYKEFMENEFWINQTYWWQTIYEEPKTREIRIDYLTALISNIK